MTNTLKEPDAVSEAYAHVLDIELTAPVAGLQRKTPEGRKADRAWALVRLFGEPLSLDVLGIPPGDSVPRLSRR